MSDSNLMQLNCIAISGTVTTGEGKGEGEASDCTTVVSENMFQQESGKKSSFLLSLGGDEGSSLTITQPAHLIVECCSSNFDPNTTTTPTTTTTTHQFLLGGFQLVSTAKQVEIYITDQGGNETYLMTSKGILLQNEKGQNGEEWQKAMCVIPGGPRPIIRLKLKLLHLKPNGINEAKIQSLKLTARFQLDTPAAVIPQQPSTANEATDVTRISPQSMLRMKGLPLQSPSFGKMFGGPVSSSQTNAGGGSSGGISDSDLRAAMATLSIVARTTESNIESSMVDKFQSLERIIHQRFTTIEQQVGILMSVISSQQQLLEQQSQFFQIQQQTIKTQSERIEHLIDQQHVTSEMMNGMHEVLLSLEKETDEEKPGHPNETVALLDPTERGIEHTLSNLERSHAEDDDDETDEVLSIVTERSETPKNTTGTMEHPSVISVDGDTNHLMTHSEKIEVSLSGNNQHDVLTSEVEQEVVPGLEGQQRHSHPSNDVLSSGDGLMVSTKSFEDRNDKSAVTEVNTDTPHAVQLEVMMGIDEMQTVNVLESMTADEHERSPPDITETNFFDL